MDIDNSEILIFKNKNYIFEWKTTKTKKKIKKFLHEIMKQNEIIKLSRNLRQDKIYIFKETGEISLFKWRKVERRGRRGTGLQWRLVESSGAEINFFFQGKANVRATSAREKTGPWRNRRSIDLTGPWSQMEQRTQSDKST